MGVLYLLLKLLCMCTVLMIIIRKVWGVFITRLYDVREGGLFCILIVFSFTLGF
jgi:hypothetical protein